MNKIILSAALIFIAAPAMAHIEIGTHKGTTADGQECSFVAGAQTFENDMRHPLNERVQITIGTDTFKVQHPAVIDNEKGIAHFNHDLFQAVLPTAKGAKALTIDMVHSDEFDGPAAFTLIESEWKTGTHQVTRCAGLKFQK